MQYVDVCADHCECVIVRNVDNADIVCAFTGIPLLLVLRMLAPVAVGDRHVVSNQLHRTVVDHVDHALIAAQFILSPVGRHLLLTGSKSTHTDRHSLRLTVVCCFL